MNTRRQLLSIVLLSMTLIVNSASAECIAFDFCPTYRGNSDRVRDLLNSYDSTGLFKGFLVCINNATVAGPEDPRTIHCDGSVSSGVGSGVGSNFISVSYKHKHIKIEISEPHADRYGANRKVLEPDPGEEVRNVTQGSLEIQGQFAEYLLYEVVTQESISRKTGKPINYAGLTGTQTLREYWDERNSARTINKYHWAAKLYYPIDSAVVLTWKLGGKTPEDAISAFRSINVTAIYGENPRHLINEATQAYNSGDYNKFMEYYQNISADEDYQKLVNRGSSVVEIPDLVGIALYRLGRYNEALEWFDYHKPGRYDASEGWTIYGKLLEMQNFTDEAEYAFSEAERQKEDLTIRTRR